MITQLEQLGIIVFGHTRYRHLQALLSSLARQDSGYPVHVWLDGHHGKKELRKRVEACATLVKNQYPSFNLKEHNGQIGIEKMTLDGLAYMCRRYDGIIVLEDDCFPTSRCIRTFVKCLQEIDTRDDIYSVYGHHFLVPAEKDTITRFQGWGWASTRDKILPVLSQLQECFRMSERQYLNWVKRTLTPEIETRLNVTPPRNCLVPLNMFFCWDACTSLITASRKMVHVKTPRRVIYNCGMGKDSTHFLDDPMMRNPPFNMIHVEEVWRYYHSDVDPEPIESQDVESARKQLLAQIDAHLYDKVIEEIESGRMDGVLKRYEQTVAEMVCRIGKGQFLAADARLDDLAKEDSAAQLPAGKVAAVGCLLLMKRYDELQQFLKQLLRGVEDDLYKRTMLPVSTSFHGPENLKKHQIVRLLEDHRTGCEFQDELYYRLGLEMHHAAEKLSGGAASVYKNIMANSDYMPKFRSWAFFKFGEICQATGKVEQARTSFEKALEIDPSHVKARIALAAGPLPVVEINTPGKEHPASLRVKMDLFSKELWRYYFEGRKIILLIIALEDGFAPNSIASLGELVKPYMESEGTIRFLVNDNMAEKLSEIASSCFAGERCQVVEIATGGQ